MAVALFAISYEGSELDHFLVTLITAEVSHVIDIRDVPASRKRGFLKSALTLAFDKLGISYNHLKALGDPKPRRESMRRGDYDAFLTIYGDHVQQPGAQAALLVAVIIASAE